MRILILGGDGMLGHRLFAHLRQRHEARVTLRRDLAAYSGYGLFDRTNSFDRVDLRGVDRLSQVLGEFRPQAIINAVGIVKHQAEAADAITTIEVNALLPHRLEALCRSSGTRLVHMSTDCVFSGLRGNYRESDRPDPDDFYGRSKLLGEVRDTPSLTLRTSIIGPELARKTGLLEWFLSQRGSIKGFRKAIFSGFTTLELSRIIERLLNQFPRASGIYHVSSAPINKHELLLLIKQKLGLQVEIKPDDEFVCDRSLDSTRFRQEFGYNPPPWETMIDELARTIKEAAR